MARKLTADSGASATQGHNAKIRKDAIKSSLERLYQIDAEIDDLIESSGIKDLRAEKSEIKTRLRDDYSMPSKLVMARYAAYRIERAAEDGEDGITMDAIREMYAALPVGGMVDLVDAMGQGETPANGSANVDIAVARTAGREAGRAGKAAINNPHPAGSDRHTAWLEGWKEGQSEIAESMGPDGDAPEPDASERRPKGRKAGNGAAAHAGS